MAVAASKLSILRRKARSAVFHARAFAGVGALPHLLIIGAQKSGTTSLFTYLGEHPDVCASRSKEPQYFDRQYCRGEKWYRAHFRPKPHHIIRMEASTHSLFHPLSAQRVRKAIPDAKLIAILRNPVDRAYSQYNQSGGFGFETLSFEDALAAEENRLSGWYEKIEREEVADSLAFRQFSYVTRGLYAEQIERWLRHFPSEQFLFLKAEDMFASPQECLANVHRFLGLRSLPLRDGKPQNQLEYARMDTAVREQLERVFAGPNADLKRLTGIGWP